MNWNLSDLLGTILVLESRTLERIQVFGLSWQHTNTIHYQTLDEALTRGTLEIAERSEDGQVPLLHLVNHAHEPVFLMAGEQLVGAKQNRVLNVSILAAPLVEMTIPVSCVEAGRWRYSSSKFGSPGTMSHGKLRSLISRHIHENAGRGFGPASNQAEVWEEVERKLDHLASPSSSSALQQAYDDYQSRLNKLTSEIHTAPTWTGSVFAIGGRVTGIDLFDKPSTLAKLWPKLVRAYALDAFEEKDTAPHAVTADAVRSWLHQLVGIPSHIGKSTGLGNDIRLRSENIVGSSLVVEDCPIHTEFFALEASA